MCKVLKALFHRTPPPQELLERTAAAEPQLLEAGTEKNMLEAELSRLPITSSGRTIRVRLASRDVLGFAGVTHGNCFLQSFWIGTAQSRLCSPAGAQAQGGNRGAAGRAHATDIRLEAGAQAHGRTMTRALGWHRRGVHTHATLTGTSRARAFSLGRPHISPAGLATFPNIIIIALFFFPKTCASTAGHCANNRATERRLKTCVASTRQYSKAKTHPGTIEPGHSGNAPKWPHVSSPSPRRWRRMPHCRHQTSNLPAAPGPRAACSFREERRPRSPRRPRTDRHRPAAEKGSGSN